MDTILNYIYRTVRPEYILVPISVTLLIIIIKHLSLIKILLNKEANEFKSTIKTNLIYFISSIILSPFTFLTILGIASNNQWTQSLLGWLMALMIISMVSFPLWSTISLISVCILRRLQKHRMALIISYLPVPSILSIVVFGFYAAYYLIVNQ